MKNAIGVIGCGAMGKGMVKNLLKHNYSVFIYDVNPSATKDLAELGAIPKKTIIELARNTSFVLTSLPSAEVLKEVLEGEAGLFTSMNPGSYVLDMGTTDVDMTRSLNKKARDKGMKFYDCPVSGGPKGADEGTLSIMVGGDKVHFYAIEPILEAIGKKITLIGESGSGQVVKLCNNMIVAGTTVLLGEAFLAGKRAGVPPEILSEIFQTGSAQSKVLEVFGPNILTEDFENVIFSLNHMAKDLKSYKKLAEQSQAPLFIATFVDQLYEKAVEEGNGNFDSTAVNKLLVSLAKS